MDLPGRKSAMDSTTDTGIALYQPLQPGSSEIRLLNLLPAVDESSQLQGYLVTVALEHAPSTPDYVALSYEWGNEASRPEDECHIRINHHDMRIRYNLALALLCFRKRITQPLVIWIDALCINQADLNERGVQVDMMRRIYELASGVWVWLGPEADDSNLAMAVIDEVQSYGEMGNHSRPNKGMIYRLLYDAEYEKHRRSLCKLLERSYWRRLWIIQEVILGARGDLPLLCCGEQMTALGHIFKLVSWLRDPRDEPALATPLKLATDLVLGLHDHIKEHSNQYAGFREADILQILARYRRNLCSDPRDKIYGLLGVMPARLKVDYSISAAELYEHVARLIIASSNSLDLLQWCVRHERDGRDASDGRPSWAPDWSVDLESSNLRLCFHPRVFESKNSRKEPDPQIIDDQLYVSAILRRGVIDVLQVPQSKRSLSAEERLRCLLELISSSLPWQAAPDPKNPGRLRSLCYRLYQTLCYPSHDPDWTIDSKKAEDFVSWCIDSLKGNFAPLRDVSDICQVLDQPELKLFTCAKGLRRVPNSDPAICVKHPFGLCLAQARAGDVVAFLNKCKYPVLIREKEQDRCDIEKKSPALYESCETSFETSAIYEVVGECYVTGFRQAASGREAANICLV
jgi:Heterokaryon incompatibility protein (HET)